jgi:hypothetical protein
MVSRSKLDRVSRRTSRRWLVDLLIALFLLLTCNSILFAADQQLLVVVKDGKYGYIDHSGNIIIAPQFTWAEDFYRGLGSVYVCGRYVSIDASGRLVPPRNALEGHLAPKTLDSKVGFVNPAGQFQIAPIFDEALPFSEGLAAVRLGDQWGFIDASGAEKIAPQFQSAYYFREGVAFVETSTGYVLIDTSGKVLATGFEPKDIISAERVPVSKGDKAGYLDLRGRIAIPLIYDSVTAFHEGIAAVEKGDKWGYINTDGKIVIPIKFDDAGPFGNGLAPAVVGKTSGFIDKSGRFSFYLAFHEAPGFLGGDDESDLFIAPSDVSRFWTDAWKFGYVDTTGRIIWGPAPESPDHPPLLGWSEKDKEASCNGIDESTRAWISRLPD